MTISHWNDHNGTLIHVVDYFDQKIIQYFFPVGSAAIIALTALIRGFAFFLKENGCTKITKMRPEQLYKTDDELFTFETAVFVSLTTIQVCVVVGFTDFAFLFTIGILCLVISSLGVYAEWKKPSPNGQVKSDTESNGKNKGGLKWSGRYVFIAASIAEAVFTVVSWLPPIIIHHLYATSSRKNITLAIYVGFASCVLIKLIVFGGRWFTLRNSFWIRSIIRVVFSVLSFATNCLMVLAFT